MQKLKNSFKVVSAFFSFQLLIQGLDSISGLILVRELTKSQYALFGIITSFSVSILNLIISGGVSFFISTGVKLKNNKEALSALFYSVRIFLQRKIIPFFVVCFPIILYILFSKNFDTLEIFILGPMIVVEIYLRIQIQLFQAVLSINSEFNRIQWISVLASTSRVIILILCLKILRSELAYLSLVISYSIQFVAFRAYSNKYLKFEVINKKYIDQLNVLHKSQLPINLYAAIDAQLVVVLVSYLGGFELLGDYTAVGKLGLVFTFLSTFVNNVLVAKFAAIEDRLKFVNFQITVLSLFILLYALIFTCIVWNPDVFLILVGEKYRNTKPFLWSAVLGLCMVNFSSVIYAINFSKTWIHRNWLVIPLTISAQIIGIVLMPPKNLESINYYVIICGLPTLILNIIFNLKGIRKM